MGKPFVSHRIEERSFVSYVKREIHMEVSRGTFPEKKVASIDIIVAELTSNLIKHAGGGEVLYRTTESTEGPVFEVLSIDKGPGMSDPERMMVDGVSTSGTLGQGLGAIARLSTESQIYSTRGTGTIIYSRVSSNTEKKKEPSNHFRIDVKALCVSKPRETVCGDGFEVVNSLSATKVFFGDGLGHGVNAKAAVDSARNFFFWMP